MKWIISFFRILFPELYGIGYIHSLLFNEFLWYNYIKFWTSTHYVIHPYMTLIFIREIRIVLSSYPQIYDLLSLGATDWSLKKQTNKMSCSDNISMGLMKDFLKIFLNYIQPPSSMSLSPLSQIWNIFLKSLPPRFPYSFCSNLDIDSSTHIYLSTI